MLNLFSATFGVASNLPVCHPACSPDIHRDKLHGMQDLMLIFSNEARAWPCALPGCATSESRATSGDAFATANRHAAQGPAVRSIRL